MNRRYKYRYKQPHLDNLKSFNHVFRVIENDGNYIVPSDNANQDSVQMVGQYEGHFDGVGYGILSDDFVITDYLYVKCRIKCTSETAGRIIHLGGRYPKKAMTLTVGGRVIAFGVNREYRSNLFKTQGNYDTIMLNEWHDIECLYFNNVSTIKIDGNLVGTTEAISSNTADTRLAIGAKPDGTQQSSFGIQYLEIDNGVKTIDLDFSTGKESTIYSKDSAANHATLVNMALNTFWQQGTGKPTLALEGCNYSTVTGYIPARNDDSGLDAIGNPIQIKPYQWEDLPLYGFKFPAGHMDRSNTTIWTDDARSETYDSSNPTVWKHEDLKSLETWANPGYDRIAYAKFVKGRLDSIMVYDSQLNFVQHITTTDYTEHSYEFILDNTWDANEIWEATEPWTA